MHLYTCVHAHTWVDTCTCRERNSRRPPPTPDGEREYDLARKLSYFLTLIINVSLFHSVVVALFLMTKPLPKMYFKINYLKLIFLF